MGTTVPVDVEASVRDALVAELGIEADAVVGDAELSLLPGMESVKLLRIVSALEEVHGVALDDDALFSIDTVDDLVRVLRGGPAAGGTAAESGP
ncbi:MULTISPECIES: acyl carrier protein [unclassified Streptomyces]|uniref:acyl carrier protein n=1 Tax=unclassified Streptomyces TaxID=2593676 RepID=UPI00236245E7|nr:acyl carrier protein [Streptomyces sp. MMBL 11-1]